LRRERLEKKETPTGDPLGTSFSLHASLSRSPASLFNLHIIPLFDKLHGYQHGEKTGISIYKQSARSSDDQGLHASAAPLTASKVARLDRALSHRQLNTRWLEGLLHIHYILLLNLCYSNFSGEAICFRDLHISKRLIAPSCML
jgi:hypothetical protein